LHSPEMQKPGPRWFGILIAKEWRNLASGRAFWLLLLLLCPLVGFSYVQAVGLYGEASRSAAQLPEVARNLSPLDGVLVPTFGALYLANTFLFPFVAIRSIAHEKETGSLKLLLQLPPSVGAVLGAKIAALACAWVLVSAPALSAVALWAMAGGHVYPPELANVLLGHWLYGAIVTGFALIAAALAESSATAAIITLAITLGFWLLDFAASGDGGVLKSLAGLSLTALLRGFERGIFALGSVLAALVTAAGLAVVAGILIDLKLTAARKLTLAATALVSTTLLIAGSAQLRLYADTSEDRRNSFVPADSDTLSGLQQRLTIVVRLAPEDPRFSARCRTQRSFFSRRVERARWKRHPKSTAPFFTSTADGELKAAPPALGKSYRSSMVWRRSRENRRRRLPPIRGIRWRPARARPSSGSMGLCPFSSSWRGSPHRAASHSLGR
jgi:ABC-2 type transport system permease protein